MRIRLGNGLIPLLALVLLLVLVIYLLPDSGVRIILGFPFVLLFPGFVLTVAIFPAATVISGWMRLTLSIGLSIAIAVILGLFLNFTLWGIRLESLLGGTIVFILVGSGIAWYRQRKLPAAERFNIDYALELSWGRWGKWDRVLTVVTVLAILAACGVGGYALANPGQGQKFTEFYILGKQGTARDYPRELVVGQTSEVTAGIINHEYETKDYRIEVSLNGSVITELMDITLSDGQKWEDKVHFVPLVAGPEQLLEFRLYKNGELDTAMVPLRLHINVSESP